MTRTRFPSFRIACLAALAAGLIVVASPAVAKGQARDGEVPPDCDALPPPPAPPAAGRCAVPAPALLPAAPVAAPTAAPVKGPHPEDSGPSPVGGFTLPKGGFGFKMELGYPNMDVGLAFALGSRVQLGAGYRTMYTLNHTPYVDLKISLNSRNRDVFGLALQLTAGYSFGSEDYENTGNLLAGEYHWFAEAWLRATARRGRHGLLLGIGARVTQAVYEGYDYYDEWDQPDRKKVMGVLALEIGYELRINRIASFYLALGVDIFTAKDWIPALPRFRMGVLLGS